MKQMEKQSLEMMQSWLDDRNKLVDKTIDNINQKAERGNEKAQTLQKLDKTTLRRAANEAIEKATA